MSFAAKVVVAAALVAGSAQADPAFECRTFEEIYGSAKSMCENMWDGAFEYVESTDSRYELAYTMWFFENENPNDAVTQARVNAGLHADVNNTDVCHLDYFHLEEPTTEPNTFTECHPWRNRACCAHETVTSGTVLKEAYGPEYHWDRCGPISQECERFFVQEACFYECDVNVGLFLGEHNKSHANYTGWKITAMPIKADYCDAMYAACKNQLGCGVDNGNIFSCARVYEEPTQAPTPGPAEGLQPGAIAAIVVLSFLVVSAVVLLCVMTVRERSGNPCFGSASLAHEYDDNAQNGRPQTQASQGSQQTESVSQI